MDGITLCTLSAAPLSTNVYGVEFEDIKKIQVTSGLYKLANVVLFQVLSTYKDGQGSFLRSYVASSILYEADNLLLDTLLSSEMERVTAVIKDSQKSIIDLPDAEKLDALQILSIDVDMVTREVLVRVGITNKLKQKAFIQF